MKATIRVLALLGLMLMIFGSVCCAAEYRTLQLGDTGDDVMALKQRMYTLGYFSSSKFAPSFNETTRDRLMELQKKNGLKADGIATPEVQAFIFSDECLPKSAPTATPQPKATKSKKQPTATPAAPKAPATDADGFLPAGEKAFTYADRKSGVWTYISDQTHIEIRQYTGKSEFGANLWLEATIRLKDPTRLTSMLSSGKKPGTVLVQPKTILSENSGVILAFNDDFFGYRVRYGGKIGVIVRNGAVLYDDPKKATSKVFPPLDLMAVFEDGTMKTFASDEHTAQEYVQMGVRDTYAFGPILVRDGKLNKDAAKWGVKRAPRLAWGVKADGTIVVVDVLGRRTDAKGVNIGWMAQKMYDLGCVEALNLDGGNTTCLIFLGDMINRPVNTAAKDIRYITGLIGIKEEP